MNNRTNFPNQPNPRFPFRNFQEPQQFPPNQYPGPRAPPQYSYPPGFPHLLDFPYQQVPNDPSSLQQLALPPMPAYAPLGFASRPRQSLPPVTFPMSDIFQPSSQLQELFKKKEQVGEKANQENEPNPENENSEIPQRKDIQVKYFDRDSDVSAEDLCRNTNDLNPNAGGLLPENKQEFFDQNDPKITIISPHLVQLFKKNAKRLDRQRNSALDLKTRPGGPVWIKTRLPGKPPCPKLPQSKKIKKQRPKENPKKGSQRSFLTINQHINIQNINPPTPYFAAQTRESFPIQNPVKDYKRFKEMFAPSDNSSELGSLREEDPAKMRENWDRVYDLNLEEKLYLDVATSNVYLRVDNKNDSRFKHFEHLHRQSIELKDVESQLVPLAESLLPSHLQKLRKMEQGRQSQSFVEADLKELELEKAPPKEKKGPPPPRKKDCVRPPNPSQRRRLKTGCKCSKSKCLRLHCICFKQGKFCSALCGCDDCFNLEEFKDLVEKVKKATKDINSTAFESKFLEVKRGDRTIRITKGCTCLKNNCLKNYCECRKHGMPCTTLCKCDNCFNDYVKLSPEEVMRMHTKNSRKKKKIIFQTKVELRKKGNDVVMVKKTK